MVGSTRASQPRSTLRSPAGHLLPSHLPVTCSPLPPSLFASSCFSLSLPLSSHYSPPFIHLTHPNPSIRLVSLNFYSSFLYQHHDLTLVSSFPYSRSPLRSVTPRCHPPANILTPVRPLIPNSTSWSAQSCLPTSPKSTLPLLASQYRRKTKRLPMQRKVKRAPVLSPRSGTSRIWVSSWSYYMQTIADRWPCVEEQKIELQLPIETQQLGW